MANPLDKVKAGLQAEGAEVPLQSVHVRAQLIDLAAKVVVMQAYRNNSPAPIEAKYVFPLDDMAAVCGFEAFINGKHVVGQVKEKEQAHREYREAIAQGHGAYLMDEETPVCVCVCLYICVYVHMYLPDLCVHNYHHICKCGYYVHTRPGEG